jgi:hypothetical protein
VQSSNAQGVGRRDAQAHSRNTMGSLTKGNHSKNHDLQRLVASQGAELSKRHESQGSFQKNLASRGGVTIEPNKRAHPWNPLGITREAG